MLAQGGARSGTGTICVAHIPPPPELGPPYLVHDLGLWRNFYATAFESHEYSRYEWATWRYQYCLTNPPGAISDVLPWGFRRVVLKCIFMFVPLFMPWCAKVWLDFF